MLLYNQLTVKKALSLMLKELLDSIVILNKPDILFALEGIALSYKTVEQCTEVLTCIQENLTAIPYQQINHQLMIPDFYFPVFLQRFELDQARINSDLHLFYIRHHEDQIARMARSFPPVVERQSMAPQILQMGPLYRGLTQQHLLAEVTLTIPSSQGDATEPPRVIFMLDRSFSMGHDKKMEMLTGAVIDTIERLPGHTLISVYFYGSTASALVVNKAQRDITPDDLHHIREIKPLGNTEVKCCIAAVAADLRQQGLLDHIATYAHLTLVFVTDGDDEEIETAEDFAQAFVDEGYPLWPHLMTVGIGEYNPCFLNDVAADARFQTNLMLHIDSPENTMALFQVVADNVGVGRRRVGLVIEVDDKIVTEDLGTMQTLTQKKWIIEIPRPQSTSTTMHFSLLMDQGLSTESMDVCDPEHENALQNVRYWVQQENRDMIYAYLEQTLQKVIIALNTHPVAGEAMRRHILRSTNAAKYDVEIEALREKFRQLIPSHSLYQDIALKHHANRLRLSPAHLGRKGSFRPVNKPQTCTQHQYSQALQSQYSQALQNPYHQSQYLQSESSTFSEVNIRKEDDDSELGEGAQCIPGIPRHAQHDARFLAQRMASTIKRQHLITNDTGLDIEKTLIAIFNDALRSYGETRAPIKQFEFCKNEKKYFLMLGVTLDSALLEQSQEVFFARWSEAMGGYAHAVHHHNNTRDVTLYLADPRLILRVFGKIGYETLLEDVQHIDFAYRVDLLQTLITETIRQLIIDSKMSDYPPEQIEFDKWGQLSAEVVSPSKTHYCLRNTMAVIGFLKQYGHLEIPAYFAQLLRKQTVINTQRAQRYLTSLNVHGMPVIIATYQFHRVEVCGLKKQVTLFLERRDKKTIAMTVQERRIFQVILQEKLGAQCCLFWRTGYPHDRLVISSQLEHEWQQNRLERLQDVLIHTQLLSLSVSSSIDWHALLGPLQRGFVIPEAIESILECHIMRALPEQGTTLSITPDGYTYFTTAIEQHARDKHLEPLTKNPCEAGHLRLNHLAKELVTYYQQLATQAEGQDPLIYPPAALINPDTNNLYIEPVVRQDGTTVEGASDEAACITQRAKRTRGQLFPSEALYPNRCVQDLLEFYRTTMVPLEIPVQRASIRTTLGANIGLLCPGVGQLSFECAKDEAEFHMPYVDYDPWTQTLAIDFISGEYARRLALGLKRWTCPEQLISVFTSNNLKISNTQTQRIIRLSQAESITLTYQASLSITGEKAIRALIETLCHLSSDYFNALTELSDTHGFDTLNHVLQLRPLAPWCTQPECSRQSTADHFNVLSIRAAADYYRIAGASQRLFDHHSIEDESAEILVGPVSTWRNESSRSARRADILTQVDDQPFDDTENDMAFGFR